MTNCPFCEDSDFRTWKSEKTKIQSTLATGRRKEVKKRKCQTTDRTARILPSSPLFTLDRQIGLSFPFASKMSLGSLKHRSTWTTYNILVMATVKKGEHQRGIIPMIESVVSVAQQVLTWTVMHSTPMPASLGRNVVYPCTHTPVLAYSRVWKIDVTSLESILANRRIAAYY